MVGMSGNRVAIFCQVVDNYGDIGVCWRLARQWCAEFGLEVTLWVDDLHSFQRLCKAVNAAAPCQTIAGVVVRTWTQEAAHGFDEADAVIEAFGCHLPETVIAQMQKHRPVWINLDYLSAEAWVESCHGALSPHISGLNKYFFFPGFSAQTGGLLAERKLFGEQSAFLADAAAQAAWWQGLAWPSRPAACVISLFCYPHAPLADLFAVWMQSAHPIVCLVPQGVAREAIAVAWPEISLQEACEPGKRLTQGALTLQIIPFVDQPEYDRLLWMSDINLVRGEDSFVRAQWAARPLLWHIYPQQAAAHLEKLGAFMAMYTARLPPSMQTVALDLALAWNQPDPAALRLAWPRFFAQWQESLQWQQHALAWREDLALNGNLADKLLHFIRKIV